MNRKSLKTARENRKTPYPDWRIIRQSPVPENTRLRLVDVKFLAVIPIRPDLVPIRPDRRPNWDVPIDPNAVPICPELYDNRFSNCQRTCQEPRASHDSCNPPEEIRLTYNGFSLRSNSEIVQGCASPKCPQVITPSIFHCRTRSGAGGFFKLWIPGIFAVLLHPLCCFHFS